MARYKLLTSYDGTRYSGWQIQPNAPTVEEKLENAFCRILQEEVDIIGQGRTDSGVHAEEQVAHVDIRQDIEIGKLLYALLGVLPRDISVWHMAPVPNDFHARFHGKSRRYRYQIVTRPDPLLYRFASLQRYDLDMAAMRQCAVMIKGNHDFESFSKTDKDQSDAVCTVDLSELRQERHLITYHIRANRFVRHMVRRLVGTMLQVGQGKHTAAHFRKLLEDPSGGHISHGADAKGLILEKVEY